MESALTPIMCYMFLSKIVVPNARVYEMQLQLQLKLHLPLACMDLLQFSSCLYLPVYLFFFHATLPQLCTALHFLCMNRKVVKSKSSVRDVCTSKVLVFIFQQCCSCCLLFVVVSLVELGKSYSHVRY